MKYYTILFLFIVIPSYGQIDIVQMQSDREKYQARFAMSIALLNQEYIEYCYADSVLVGFEYVLDETISENGSVSTHTSVYNPDYRERFPSLDYNSFAYGCFFNEKEVWKNYIYRYSKFYATYVRCLEIKQPHELPTYEGFAIWLAHKVTGR